MSDIIETAKRVLALSEKATPGPWRPAGREGSRVPTAFSGKNETVGTVCEVVSFEHRPENATLIAEYRTDAPALAAYVAAVAPLVERLRQVHDYWDGPARDDCLAEVCRRGAGEVLRDMRRQYQDATDALLAADAAARGGK